MLTTFFIPPHPCLLSFVDNYILSTSGEGIVSFNGYWPASNETSLIFYMADAPQHHNTDYSDATLSGKRNCVVGLLTHSNGAIKFTGRYCTFMIQFKANGFNKIFRMPMNDFTDKIFTAEDVFGKQINDLHEQLREVTSIQQKACLADKFLLTFLNNNKKTDTLYDGITAIAGTLYNTTKLLSIEEYAYKANMSIRNFERRFTEQAGISPKLYTKLVRFNEVMKVKVKHPEKNWTSIAYECGYYDQMHLIKDFKRFTNFSPTVFFQKNNDTTRPRIDLLQPDNATFNHLNNNLPEEEFVLVKRPSF